MATRTYQRPAKNKLTAAKRDRDQANIAMGRHYSGCYQCSHHRQNPGDYCDTGWQLVKAATRANAAVRRLEDAGRAQPAQGLLW